MLPDIVEVNLPNATTWTVVVPQKAILYEVQTVMIADDDLCHPSCEVTSILEKVELDESSI